MTDFDVVVVGGGAAGLSAALVLSRARRHVLVVDSGMPRNAPASQMHGFLSRDGLPPSDLLELGREEVARYGGQIVDASVARVESLATGFRVALGSGLFVSARRLLVATGLRDELPDIPGLQERWARDVLHCPYCHGFEVRDQVWACQYGIGLFEDRLGRGLNENMLIEVGSMTAIGRRCALLKDLPIEKLPTDFVGQIYKEVDFDDVPSVVRAVHRWAADDLGLGRCPSCPAD